MLQPYATRIKLITLVLLALFAALLVLNTTLPAQASPHSVPEANTAFLCGAGKIVGVGSFKNRIALNCADAYTGGGLNIRYFAYPTSDSANASRMLSILTSAMVTGRAVYVWFDPNDTSGAAYGCGAGDCRAINTAELR